MTAETMLPELGGRSLTLFDILLTRSLREELAVPAALEESPLLAIYLVSRIPLMKISNDFDPN
jgi:hypothetical protein